ncbi:KH domain-containing protein [Nymphaea thermarum]|nr:KH domain-containing protein [Nymphaea thermarum]
MSSGGRYMAYSPSPSTASPSPHIAAALVEHDKYLSDLLAEREKLGPFVQILPHSYRVLNQEILRVTTLLGNASFLDQTGLEHASPLTSGGLFSNGADRNVWAPTFHSEVRILTINITTLSC